MEALRKALQLRKAKYIRRWRGKNGKLYYEYKTTTTPKRKLTDKQERSLKETQKLRGGESYKVVNETNHFIVVEFEQGDRFQINTEGSVRHTTASGNKRPVKEKEIDNKLTKEGEVVERGIYQLEGDMPTFASADKKQLIYFVSKNVDDIKEQIESKIKQRKDGAYVYEETEDIYRD